MRIVACLAWYAEPEGFLTRTIESLAGIADAVIAFDGAWELFPHDTHLSPESQRHEITEAAEKIGAHVEVWHRGTPWASQVAKRDVLVRAAAKRGDWLFVIDGDEYVAAANPDALRAGLAATERDVAMIACKRTTGYEGVNGAQPIRRIYRASTGVRVDTAHNGYRTEDGRWLHGDGAYTRLEPAEDLSAHLLLHHERLNRGEERNRAAMEYRKRRMETGVERWRR